MELLEEWKRRNGKSEFPVMPSTAGCGAFTDKDIANIYAQILFPPNPVLIEILDETNMPFHSFAPSVTYCLSFKTPTKLYGRN